MMNPRGNFPYAKGSIETGFYTSEREEEEEASIVGSQMMKNNKRCAKSQERHARGRRPDGRFAVHPQINMIPGVPQRESPVSAVRVTETGLSYVEQEEHRG